MILGRKEPELVAVYLHMFKLQRPVEWNNLGEILGSDPRLAIGGEPAAEETAADAVEQQTATDAAAAEQPPETEPSKRASSSTTSWLPTGRGEEPQVCTTVASATDLPSSRHAAAVPRMSSCSALIWFASVSFI